MADKNGLQLLPENRKRLEINIPGENKLIYAGAALAVLVVLATVGLAFYNSRLNGQIDELDNQIREIETKRDKKTEENLVVLSKQLALLGKVFSEHIFWSQGFGILGNALQNSVQFQNFSTSLSEGKVTFRAVTNSYATIARQIASFVSHESIKDVTLDSVNTRTDGRLEMSMTLHFEPGKFLKTVNRK